MRDSEIRPDPDSGTLPPPDIAGAVATVPFLPPPPAALAFTICSSEDPVTIRRRLTPALVLPALFTACSTQVETPTIASREALTADFAFPLTADSYVKQGEPNRAQGAVDHIRIRKSGNNRGLFTPDLRALSSLLVGGSLDRVQLELTISHTASNWGPTGRAISLHAMTQAWTESGATWNCADDTEPSNNKPDCAAAAWIMQKKGPHP